MPKCSVSLSNFISMMHRFMLLAAGMDIKSFSQIFDGHGRTFDVPARKSPPPPPLWMSGGWTQEKDEKKTPYRQYGVRDDADADFFPGLRGTVDSMLDPSSSSSSATATATATATVVVPVAPVAAECALTPGGRSLALLRAYGVSVNGTWDLVASLVDSGPYTASRFDSGAAAGPWAEKTRPRAALPSHAVPVPDLSWNTRRAAARDRPRPRRVHRDDAGVFQPGVGHALVRLRL